jgi:CheY-like chemotaxis protein
VDNSGARRVLVVDDESNIRELIAEALDEFGYLVDSAADGAEALDALRHATPDVIVLDLMMPRLNGFGFVESLQVDPPTASIPVLLVTAAYAPHDAARRIGAQACLSKPFELDRLVQLVGDLAAPPPPLPLSVPSEVAARERQTADA